MIEREWQGFNIRNGGLHTHSLPEVQTSCSVHMLGSGNMKIPGKKCPISCPCQLPGPTAALQGCLQTSLALGELLGIHTSSSASSQDWPLNFLPPLSHSHWILWVCLWNVLFPDETLPSSLPAWIIAKADQNPKLHYPWVPFPWGTRTVQISRLTLSLLPA